MNSPPIDPASPTDANLEQFNVFSVLKKGTADIHHLIEGRVPVFRESFNLDDYARLVEQFLGFWSPVEERLHNLSSLQDPRLALQSRLKSSLLGEDLRALGRDPTAVRECEKLPQVGGFLEGLGCLYVLEGSTLGSQIIARRLEEHLKLGEGTGASYFNAYGAVTGARWMEFKAYVSASVDSEHADAMVKAAQETFTCFYDWLGSV